MVTLMCVSEGDVTVDSELEPLTQWPPLPKGVKEMTVRDTEGQLGKQSVKIWFSHYTEQDI